MVKKSRFDALNKKQAQIDAYYEKIKELQQQQEKLENEFALKVGQLILKKLGREVADIEQFSDWLDVYVAELDAEESDVDAETTEDTNGILPESPSL